MKLLVCDVEGTIFKAKYRIEGTDYASTMWQPIAHRLGEAAIQEERETHQRWENKEYGNYLDWVAATIAIHKKYGLHRDEFTSLVQEAEYNDGVLEFFAHLDRKEYIPVLISGGFQELIRRAQKDLKIPHGYGACEYFFDEVDGKLAAFNLMPCDFDGKIDYIKTLFDIYELNFRHDWIFIGDGKNDVHVARNAPVSIGVTPHSELAKVVSYVVRDFRDIADCLREEEGTILLRSADIVEEDPHTSGRSRMPLSREQVLEEENQRLKKQVVELTDRARKAETRLWHIEKRSYNMRKVLVSDYVVTPPMALKEMLDEYKVVFFGSRRERKLFQTLDAYHKNLTVISGDKGRFDTRPIEYSDFIFTFNKCMGHPSSWKSESAKESVPYADIYRDNIDFVENAMGNILYREFFAAHASNGGSYDGPNEKG